MSTGYYQDSNSLITFCDGIFTPELHYTKENENDKAFWLWVNTMLKINDREVKNEKRKTQWHW